MDEPTQRQTGRNQKSPVWIVTVAVFLVLYLILQQQPKQERLAENPTSEASHQQAVSVSADETTLSNQQSDHKLDQSDQNRKNKPPAVGSTVLQNSQNPTSLKTSRTPASSNRPPPGQASGPSTDTDTELGQLRDTGNQILESTAGLKYGPGSREKHRLRHVMRHATDQPRRPGKHGVFAGDGAQKKVLALIDEAYLKALEGGKNIQKQRDGQRTVYTVEMQRPIGYVGGQVGNQQGKPPATKIRLVLEGANVITAFPL